MVDPNRPCRDGRSGCPSRTAFRQWPCPGPALPGGPAAGPVRVGLFLGRGAGLLAAPGVYSTAVGYAAGYTPNPSYREVCSGPDRAQRGGAGGVRSRAHSYPALLQHFWEAHDPTQGMRQGHDVGTQYRSGIYVYSEEQRRWRRHPGRATSSACMPPGGATSHRDPRGAGVLLCRGIPPAVPGEEPRRLLRARRLWCALWRAGALSGSRWPPRAGLRCCPAGSGRDAAAR
jgi:methionine-S-sulfoxide reductase